jgi:hypothetical protein
MIEKVLLFSLILFVSSGAWGAEEIDSYKIPSDVQIGEKIIPAGTYIVRIDDNSDGAFVEILKSGSEVGREKAIVLPARGSGQTTVMLINAGKKDLIRFRIREADNWYILYLKTPQSNPAQDSGLSTQN